MTSTFPKIRTFEEFWPHYLSLHSKKGTKRVHLLGTVAALIALAWVLLTGRYALLPLVLIVGYGPAWFSHFFVEGNRPATWQYPALSFRADFKLLYLTLIGKLPL